MRIIDAAVYFGPYSQTPLDTSAETVFRILKQHGIQKAVFSSLVGMHHDYQMGNAQTLELVQSHPDRVIPLASIDPHAFIAESGMIKQLRDDGFHAVGFFPTDQNWKPDYLPFLLAAREISEQRMPIFLVKADNPSAFAHSLRDIETPVIFRSAQGAGYMALAEYLAIGMRYRNTYFDIGNLVAAGSVQFLVEKLGAERLLFGSNVPFCYAGSPLLMLETARISEDQRRRIAFGTISNLLEMENGL